MNCPKCNVKLENEVIKCPSCGTRIGRLCPECKSYNLITSKICSTCQNVLLKICPECKSINHSNATICRKCGSALDVKISSEDISFEYSANYCTLSVAKDTIMDSIKADNIKVISINGDNEHGKNYRH